MMEMPEGDFTTGACPVVLTDRELNIKNHHVCINKAALGPANPKAPEEMFWLNKSEKWNVPVEAAKHMLCSNCGHYWKTKLIDDCIKSHPQPTPPEVDPNWVDTGEGGGYCDEFDIPCTASRTCDDWEPGGPITDGKFNHLKAMAEMEAQHKIMYPTMFESNE